MHRELRARKMAYIDFDALKKIGVVMKRAQYFITCKGRATPYVAIDKYKAEQMLITSSAKDNFDISNDVSQISFFDSETLNSKYIETMKGRVITNV